MRVAPLFERQFLSGRLATSGGRRLGNSGLRSYHRANGCRDRSGASQPISNFSPHERLGVSEGANMKEIKRAFRKMAMKHHPDREGGSEANFLLVIEAYEILTGKRDGKEGSEKGSWEFHDWFWQFTMNRRRSGGSPASKDDAFASRSQMQTQLAGLRHRAAVRSIKKRVQHSPRSAEESDVHASSDALSHQSDAEGSVPSHSDGEGVEFREEDFQDSGESPADSGCVGETEEESEARSRRLTEEARRRAALDGGDAKQAVRSQLSGLKRKAKIREALRQDPDWAYPCST
ncbi:hypothetical protein BSKO_09939 [Bryopsis sp. KO-2023]|nr:hypothetical protein BSKO_09939 [Bryopsis sp. KO-2023]